ncbi:hypothetical protein B0A49_03124, partial [Cryomyces minteri]
MPNYPQLPRYFPTDSDQLSFPPRAPRRRRKRHDLHVSGDTLELPSKGQVEEEAETVEEKSESQTSTVAPASDLETPATSQEPSEVDSTHPPTPPPAASAQPVPAAKLPTSPISPAHLRRSTLTAVPLIPIAPAAQRTKATTPSSHSNTSKPPPTVPLEGLVTGASESTKAQPTQPSSPSSERTPVPASPPLRAAPKSWADLVRTKGSSTNATVVQTATHETASTNGFGPARGVSLADALKDFSADIQSKVAFLEPRGLVNTGNMCYMNSIFQVLVFCVPFYEFLDQVGKRAAHSFKSETPLVDAMIMFMREFKIIDSAVTVEQLRLRLKDSELEQYGEPVIPEYVYDVIKRLPRFSSMRRGHQQDAEEFLGFLLEGLHDECVTVMKAIAPVGASGPTSPRNSITSPTSPGATIDNGWLEVGPKQKAAVTRSSGTIVTESPVTRIFGGKLRSELRVPGLKNSVTLEPYQPLQLDIGAANINNITDALKG